jgi:hypothetical protein
VRVKQILRKTAVPVADLRVPEWVKQRAEEVVVPGERASFVPRAWEEVEEGTLSVSEGTRTVPPKTPLDEEL